MNLLKGEKNKPTPDQIIVEEYQTHQVGAKLFANAGFGLFGNGFFGFSNYRVAECITGEGRRIHKKMEQMAQQQTFGFDIVFGFTDSIFVKIADGEEKFGEAEEENIVKRFVLKCREDLGVTVEIKNVFLNSIVYGKKNRFVGWSGKEGEEPIVKGLDGLADSNPLWVRRWFLTILKEIIRNPDRRFETMPNMITEAVCELESVICKSQTIIEKELKFTQRLKKYPDEYKKGVRTGVLGRLLGKDKGEEVYWYETVYKDKNTNGDFSTIVPTAENLNILQYKRLLSDKLKDTLEITGLNSTQNWFKIQNKTLTIDSYS